MSKLEQWVNATPARRRAYEHERLIVDVSEAVHEVLGARNQVDLANLLGSSKANVSQLLNGSRNMTLRTLADIAFVLGYRVEVKLQPLQAEQNQPREPER